MYAHRHTLLSKIKRKRKRGRHTYSMYVCPHTRTHAHMHKHANKMTNDNVWLCRWEKLFSCPTRRWICCLRLVSGVGGKLNEGGGSEDCRAHCKWRIWKEIVESATLGWSDERKKERSLCISSVSATHWNMLARHCNTLQCRAMQRHCKVTAVPVTHYDTLARHCNTLQRTEIVWHCDTTWFQFPKVRQESRAHNHWQFDISVLNRGLVGCISTTLISHRWTHNVTFSPI